MLALLLLTAIGDPLTTDDLLQATEDVKNKVWRVETEILNINKTKVTCNIPLHLSRDYRVYFKYSSKYKNLRAGDRVYVDIKLCFRKPQRSYYPSVKHYKNKDYPVKAGFLNTGQTSSGDYIGTCVKVNNTYYVPKVIKVSTPIN